MKPEGFWWTGEQVQVEMQWVGRGGELLEDGSSSS